MPVVIGVDPGFASCGWAAVELAGDEDLLVAVGTITTKPSDRKHGILVAHDDVRRGEELLEAMLAVIATHNPVALAVELPSGSRGARAAACLGAAKMLVSALRHITGLPLVAVSPADLKAAVTGSKTATKEQVQAALTRRFPGAAWPARKADVEHAADALGAFVACRDADVVRMARRRVA